MYPSVPIAVLYDECKKTKQNQTKFLLVVQKLIETACIFLSISDGEIDLYFYDWRLAYVAMVPLILLQRFPNCSQVMLVSALALLSCVLTGINITDWPALTLMWYHNEWLCNIATGLYAKTR